MPKGYSNLTGLPHNPPSLKGKSKTPETRKRMSLAQMGNKKGLGKKRSKEWIEMIRKLHTGKHYLLGRKRPYEERLKLSESKKGNKNPAWKGGISKIKFAEKTLFMHTLEYREWRRKVFERDHFTCVLCGDSKGGNLEADHIKPFALFPKLRLNINNGRTLCKDCHKKTPTYGRQSIYSKKKFSSRVSMGF